MPWADLWANRLIGFLERNLCLCPPKLKETAYKHIVLPGLEYCAFICNPTQVSLIHQLELMQQKAARFVLNCPWSRNCMVYVSKMLADLKGCPLKTR